MKTRGITNLGGTELCVGDTVIYMTRGRHQRVGKGVIVQFSSKNKQVWDSVNGCWGVVEVWIPQVYSWSQYNGRGYSRWLLDCDLVFPIDQSSDEIEKELTRT